MSELMHVTDANFEQEVLKADVPVVVDFWAPWCGPCRMMGPVLEKAADTYAGKLKIVKYNVDESGEVAASLGIMSIPTIAVYENGKLSEMNTGAMSVAQFASFADKYL